MNFVNIHGERLDVTRSIHQQPAPRKIKPTAPDEFHKGFRVIGFRPDDFEKAKQQRRIEIDLARQDGRALPPELTFELWAAKAHRKPVRSKPYGLLEAARDCKRLAEKAGWMLVEIVEIKRVQAAA